MNKKSVFPSNDPQHTQLSHIYPPPPGYPYSKNSKQATDIENDDKTSTRTYIII